MLSTVRHLAIVTCILVPATAGATPITPGTWSPAGPVLENGAQFWDGRSGDCPQCGVGSWLENYEGLEYLNDGEGNPVSFAFHGPPVDWKLLLGLSGLKNGVIGRRADGAFTYDNGGGLSMNSVDDPEQFVLFRTSAPGKTLYFLGIEDIPFFLPSSDRDFNDKIVTFSESRAVPEPAALLFLGTCAAAAWRRHRSNPRLRA